MWQAIKDLFNPKWTCSSCKRKYTPSRGELARLQHWGASGDHDGCPCFTEELTS